MWKTDFGWHVVVIAVVSLDDCLWIDMNVSLRGHTSSLLDHVLGERNEGRDDAVDVN